MELYMEIMFSKSELSRAQREMIAVIVSVTNNCRYGTTLHGALQHYLKDEEKLKKLKADYREVDIPEHEKTLCKYA